MTTQAHRPKAPLVIVPAHVQPKLLFVLIHGDAAQPEQLSALTESIKHAFPQAMLVLPYASQCEGDVCHWFDQSGLHENNYVQRVEQALPSLVALIRHVQAAYGLTGEFTALAGFDQGATLALEASSAHPDLAGRVLAFSGSYARLPTTAPPATTLHLFHGASDAQLPLSAMKETHEHLAALQGDATLDVASNVGHELHQALIDQAVYRLQTCVPLRSWKAALGELQIDLDTAQHDPGMPPNRTLH